MSFVHNRDDLISTADRFNDRWFSPLHLEPLKGSRNAVLSDVVYVEGIFRIFRKVVEHVSRQPRR